MPLNSDFGLCLIPGVLTFYTNLTQVEILCMKMKLKKLMWCENNPLQSISKSEQTRTSRKIA